jgi:hypothetical protein
MWWHTRRNQNGLSCYVLPTDTAPKVVQRGIILWLQNPVLVRWASFTLQAEPGRASTDRTELNRAERVTFHIASRAYPNWRQCSWHFWTARMSNQVHVFSVMDNIWWRSLLCTRNRRFWVHTHFNPRKLDLLRNTTGRRLASKHKHQPRNTLGPVRFGLQCECFHFIT